MRHPLQEPANGERVVIVGTGEQGAGAVVVKDTDSRQVYVGNPARATGRDSFSAFNVPAS